MGRDISEQVFSGADRTRFRAKVRRSLDALARMLSEYDFSLERPMAGIEIELNLIDHDGRPALRNAETLRAIGRDEFQTELAQYNIEINVPPRHIDRGGLADFESDIRDHLNAAQDTAHGIGAGLMMIGILPTLTHEHMDGEAISDNPRYRLLSEQILAARGEDIEIVIDGVDRFETATDTILPEAACTSTQFHMQVEPDYFASWWNASQSIAGVQLALGANSPFLLSKQLWHETRIALFEQATDTRSAELKAQGVRPRVWFGERWITSVFDLFEENSRYFPPLLPICEEEDPLAEIAQGRVPHLAELTLHNGTVYRWNRPVYDTAGGAPHLRIENRVLPAGPTVIDVMANAAFYFGLTAALVQAERPVWSQMSFKAAEDNFHRAARHGINAEQYWPTLGTIDTPTLVLDHLLEKAYAGLDSFGVDHKEATRLLSVIEGRCVQRQNGASWMISTLDQRLQGTPDITEAMRLTTLDYSTLMHSNQPVHTWPGFGC